MMNSEEKAESQGWDHEEIDSGDIIQMGLQEGAPGRGGPRGSPPDVLSDRELSDVVTEEPKLGLDAALAPRGILARHAADEVADFPSDQRASYRIGS